MVIQTDVSNECSDFIFGFNESKDEGEISFETSANILECTLRNIPEYCHIILLTHPPSHLFFHEGHEHVEQSQQGWFHVDMIHAFGSNRVAVLEQRIYLYDYL
jgi:hypothetical protein